jgi:hypothetical protein
MINDIKICRLMIDHARIQVRIIGSSMSIHSKNQENEMTKVKVEDRESGGREVGCTRDIGDKHG